MAAGLAVFFGSKFRVPRFASHNSFARSFGKHRTRFTSSLSFPATYQPSESDRHSLAFIFLSWLWSPLRPRCATTPEAGPLRPFLRRQPKPLSRSIASSDCTAGALGATNELWNSLRCHSVHRLQAVRTRLRR